MCVLTDFSTSTFEWFFEIIQENLFKKALTENTNGFGVLVWVVIVFVGFYKVIADRASKHGLVVVPGHRVG